MRLPDEYDRKMVGKSASLTDEQIDEIAKLPGGVAAVYQNDWLAPVLCKVKKFETENKKYEYTPESREQFNERPLKNELVKLLLKKRTSNEAEADALQPQIERILNNYMNDYLRDFGYLDEYGRLIDDGNKDFRRKYRARQNTTPEGKAEHADNLNTKPKKKRKDTRSWVKRWDDYKKERKNYERTRKRVYTRLVPQSLQYAVFHAVFHGQE